MSTTTTNNYRAFQELQISRRGGLLIIHFSGTWKRRTIYELLRAFDVANGDAGVHIIVLKGNFSAGRAEFSELQARPQSQDAVEAREVQLRSANFVMRSLAKKLLLNRKLLVALVQGNCVGLGVTICCLCDLVYATKSAHFEISFEQLDPSVELGSMWTVPQMKLLLKCGEHLSAEEAVRYGFVARLEDQENEFWQRLEQQSQLPLESLLATKRLMLSPWHDILYEALRQEGTPLAAASQRHQRQAKAKL